MTVSYEAFVYLWFDSKNRKFYLGYHKGHEDDSYTHSSHVMESFSKKAIPSHMRRRIIARGSDEEMRQLEKDLLGNRKERCWDKYYNVLVAFPPPPRYGEDCNFYVHGKSRTPEYIREINRKYREENRERAAARNREYREENREKVLEKSRKYYEKNREKMLEKDREYREENREKLLEYRKKNREKARERSRKYYEENREVVKEKARKRYHKNKAEQM